MHYARDRRRVVDVGEDPGDEVKESVKTNKVPDQIEVPHGCHQGISSSASNASLTFSVSNLTHSTLMQTPLQIFNSFDEVK